MGTEVEPNSGGGIRPALAIFALVLTLGALAYYFLIPRGVTPTLLRIGVLPDETPTVLHFRYAPLLERLTERTGIETKLIIPSNYKQMLGLFADDEIDLAYFGGLTYVQAEVDASAQPLVMREIDTRFTSWFIVRGDMAQLELDDFKGKKLTFGSRLSTSGHLMPRHFLHQQWGIEPESFFADVGYSGAHDTSALLVRDGKFDLGAVNATIVEEMINAGRIKADDLKIIWETPPYPNYVWATHEYLHDDLKNQLRQAFLNLDPENPDDRRILQGLNAKKFLPASAGDFSMLGQIAERLDLMGTGR